MDHWEPQFLNISASFSLDLDRRERQLAEYKRAERQWEDRIVNPENCWRQVHVLFCHASQVDCCALPPSLDSQPEICSLCIILTEVMEGKEPQAPAQLVWCATEGYQMWERCNMAFAPMFPHSTHLYAFFTDYNPFYLPQYFFPLIPYKLQHVWIEKESCQDYSLACSIRILPRKGIFRYISGLGIVFLVKWRQRQLAREMLLLITFLCNQYPNFTPKANINLHEQSNWTSLWFIFLH